MSGSRSTQSKLVPIAAKSSIGDPTSKVRPIAPAPPKNGSALSNPTTSVLSSALAQKRKIAPKPEEAQKSADGTRPIPVTITSTTFQIGKIVHQPTGTGSGQEGPIMFPMGANNSQLQKLKEAIDAASTEQRQTTAPAQTQLRPNAPVPIAPRPPSLVVPKTGANLGNIESTAGGSGPGGPPKPPQILPKPPENKPQSTVVTPASTPMMNPYINQGLIRLYSNGTYRLAAPNQNPAFGIQGIQLQNPALRYQLNPSVGAPGPPISQAQNFQMQQQIQMLLHQQKPAQVQQLPSSIFPVSQPQTFMPQSGALPTSSNNAQMPMLMISNQGIRSHLPGNQIPSNLYAQIQAQQQLNLSLNSNPNIPSSILAKPTMITSGIPGLPNGNSVLMRPLLMPTVSSISGPNQQQEKKEGESDDDENEPPPLLLRDEAMPPDVNDMFVQEASSMRQQIPASDPIRHVVDGFVIEESDTPFEVDKTQIEPLEVLKKAQEEAGVQKRKSKLSKEESAPSSPSKQFSVASPSSSMTRGRRSASIQKESRRSSSVKSLKSPNSTERPPSTRQNRELAQLLQMDFGPGKTPFKTTSPQEYAKEIQKQQSSLRPTQIPDYQERDSPDMLVDGGSPSSKLGHHFVELNEELCLNCQKSFAELGRRNSKYVQYCSKECRKLYKQARRSKTSKRGFDSLDSSLNDSYDSPKKMKMRLSTDDLVEMSIPSSSTIKSPTVKIYMKSPTRESIGSAPSPSTLQPPPASSNTPDHTKALEQAGLDASEAPNWGLDEVATFVNCITNSTAYGDAFKQEEIDGESLLILEADALKNTLQMKLGPALKIMKAIEWLKTVCKKI